MSQTIKPGTLKIFFGYAAGVGKTYTMLEEARALLDNGVDVLCGYIEPHTRPETMELLEGLPRLAAKHIIYRNIKFNEFDLDAALKKKPRVILVDELAHNNVAGLRNKKRYQDVEELLNAGIDVYTTLNVQHIESLNNVVEDGTGVKVRETIPDYVFDMADSVKLIDIEPAELLKRIRDGKIYAAERAETAVVNFFTEENLAMLRETALRKAADKISSESEEKFYGEKLPANKFLVCIGPSPSSSRCIRWTARAAEAFHVPWVAAYVETPENGNYDEKQKKDLDFNINLAERLGAEVATLTGHDIAKSVAEYAKLSNITNVVIGKSGGIKRIFGKTLDDKFLELLPNAEIHIVSNTNITRAYRKPVKLFQGRGLAVSFKSVLKTALYLASATLVSLMLKKLNLGDQNLILVYILSVFLISRTTPGYKYGVSASMLSVLLFNFFFTEPYFTFHAIEPGYPVTFAVMFAVAVITSALTARVNSEVKLSAERERRTYELYEINKKLLATSGKDNIISLVNEYTVKLFSRSVIFYDSEPKPEDTESGNILLAGDGVDKKDLYSANESAVAQWVFINRKQAGAGTDTLSGANAFYVPVISQGEMLGVFGVSCVDGELGHNNRLFLHAVASLAAMALEKQQLSDKQKTAFADSEKEKISKNLIKSIAHDMYKPLTGIVNDSSAILEDSAFFDKPSRDKLIAKIKEDSQWLIRTVENLLFVTRISDEIAAVEKTLCFAQDIISEAAGYIKRRYPERTVEINVSFEEPAIPMDGPLIVQAIINLIENALDNSPSDEPVGVSVRKINGQAVFEIVNNFRSISDEELRYIFDGGTVTGETSESGTGFFISKTIILAHGGKIEIKNLSPRGSAVQFALTFNKGRE